MMECYLYLVTGERPSVLTPMKDVTVVAPDPAAFECQVNPGEPPGKFRWYKESREIYNSDKFQISREDMSSKLVVTNTDLQDAVSYMCEASNKSGIVDTSAKLTVQSE